MHVLLILLFPVFPTSLHDFHVSVTYGEWSAQSQNLELVMKVFTDDLALALDDHYRQKLHLGEANESAALNSLLGVYLFDHFQVQQQGLALKPWLVGKEVEQDITFIYLEITQPGLIRELTVTNTLFFDRFNDQSHIINLKVQGKTRSVFLQEGKATGQLNFSESE